MIAREELAWCAGFFDGEGTVNSSSPRFHGVVRLSISQVDIRPLLRVQAILGTGNIRLYDNHGMKNSKSIHTWYTNKTSESIEIINKIWEFLSGPKREQVTIALNKRREQVLNFKRPKSKEKGLSELGRISI